MSKRKKLSVCAKALSVMLVASVAWLAAGMAFGNEPSEPYMPIEPLEVSDAEAPAEPIAEPEPAEEQESAYVESTESDVTDDFEYNEYLYVQEEDAVSYNDTWDYTAYEQYDYQYDASSYAGSGRIDAAYYGDGTDGPYETNGPSHEMPGYYNGRKETYYSSQVLPHYRMDEWTVDDEGFYRDSEGRYVVGVGIDEGYEIGDEIETGKGTAVVMDYGYTINYTDFYTNWD